MINKKIDKIITFIPLIIIGLLSVLFFCIPGKSNEVLSKIRFFLGDTFGTYYLVIGLLFFFVSIYIAMSDIGNIVMGDKGEKPKYSFFTWGCMMFTCGLAADILFYSFSEWIMYATNPHIKELGNVEDWVNVFTIYHWSFIPWSFYLVLAAAFGFMLYVKKRNKQRFSEACRPLLKNHTDGMIGRIIDLLAVFALLAGTATTFSVATPLMSSIIQMLFGVSIDRKVLTIIILVLTCAVYTYSLLHGFKGIGMLAKICIGLFFGLLAYVLVFGGQFGFIIDTGIQSLGKVVQNFVGLSTYTDPLRKTNFPQDWTIYFWAYWMVWCVAAPFFIGSISRGRTIRQTIIGGYVFGGGSTMLSFIILGNYSLGLQAKGINDFIQAYEQNGDLYEMIIKVINTLPLSSLIMLLVLATMIAFYATSFDSIAYTASCYSYKELKNGEKPEWNVQLLWCILLILLPIALVFAESSMNNLQSVSIVAAFPLGIVMVIILMSFLKESKEIAKHIKDKKDDYHRIDSDINAIIIAAGTASRFLPLSIEKPKGLLTVKGEVLIERQIKQLKSAGIDNITVVVGYKGEMFSYLKEMFNVKLIYNHCFNTKNNIESLYLARDEIKNTYICSSDNYFTENVFEKNVKGSYYSAIQVHEKTNEWYMHPDENGNIKDVQKHGDDGLIMLGHVFWDEEFSKDFKALLVKHHDIGDYDNKLWEDLFIDNIDNLPPMYIREYDASVIYEFDSIDELREFDSAYLKESGSIIMRNICETLNCNEYDVGGFELIHYDPEIGDNAAFYFEALGVRYIYEYNKNNTDRIIMGID